MPECPKTAPPTTPRQVLAGQCGGAPASVTAAQAKTRRELRLNFCKWLIKYVQDDKSKLITALINAAVASLGHFVDWAHLAMYCTSTLHPLPALSSVAGRQTPALQQRDRPPKTPPKTARDCQRPSIASVFISRSLHQRRQLSKPPSAPMQGHDSRHVIRPSQCHTSNSIINFNDTWTLSCLLHLRYITRPSPVELPVASPTQSPNSIVPTTSLSSIHILSKAIS